MSVFSLVCQVLQVLLMNQQSKEMICDCLNLEKVQQTLFVCTRTFSYEVCYIKFARTQRKRVQSSHIPA